MNTASVTQTEESSLKQSARVEASGRNCPFYGRMFAGGLRAPFALIDQHGNQCAIKTDSYAPCAMEIDGLRVDWRDCLRLRQIQVNL